MKITKDEAYILSVCLNEAKYDLIDHGHNIMLAMDILQQRLEEYSKDERRKGRKSMNSHADKIKRYCIRVEKSINI